jgi:undecaprenyl-diphosphatase
MNFPHWPRLQAMVDGIRSWDLATLKALYGLRIPKVLHWPLVVFVRVGDGYVWVGVAAWLFYRLPWNAFRNVVAECLLAVALSLCLYWPLKLLVRRVRPYANNAWVTQKVPPLDKFSFPSGHTMNNLAVALTLASQMPILYAPAVVIPLTLGVLRVVFGVHFLTDIVAGALLGMGSHFAAKALLPFLPWLTFGSGS